MLRVLSRPLVRLAERYLPTAFVFAVVLTFVVAIAALLSTDSGPVEIVRAWGDGLTGLLAFMALVASGYSGFVVWHMGYSGSGPLVAATPGSFVEEQVGFTIPVSETIFASWNVLGAIATVLVVVAAMMLMAPGKKDPVVELPEGA